MTGVTGVWGGWGEGVGRAATKTQQQTWMLSLAACTEAAICEAFSPSATTTDSKPTRVTGGGEGEGGDEGEGEGEEGCPRV